MNWVTLIPLILQYGVPTAEKIFQLWSSNAAPTQADFDALKALGQQTAKSQLMDALGRAGIAVDDPRAVALLNLVK